MSEPTPLFRKEGPREKTAARRKLLLEYLDKAHEVNRQVQEMAEGEDATAVHLLMGLMSRMRCDTIAAMAMVHAEVQQLAESIIAMEEEG
jgi:hypothetical protein